MNRHHTQHTWAKWFARHRSIIAVVMIALCLSIMAAHPQLVLAAPMIDLEEKAAAIAEKLTGLGRFVLLISLTVGFLIMTGSTILPEAFRENKGKVLIACLGGVLLNFAPEIVALIFD